MSLEPADSAATVALRAVVLVLAVLVGARAVALARAGSGACDRTVSIERGGIDGCDGGDRDKGDADPVDGDADGSGTDCSSTDCAGASGAASSACTPPAGSAPSAAPAGDVFELRPNPPSVVALERGTDLGPVPATPEAGRQTRLVGAF